MPARDEVKTCDGPACRRPLPKGRRRFCSDQCAEAWRPDPKQCEGPGCENTLPAGRRRFCSDLCRIRGQRAEASYDPGEVGRGVARRVRSLGKLAARNGEAEFGALWLLRSALDAAIVDAYDANRDRGVSLEALAAEAGTSRQALAQWCARRGSSFEAAHAGDDEAQRIVAPDQALEDEGGQEASDGL